MPIINDVMIYGRPSGFTTEIGQKLCRLIEEGNSLREICKMEGMPPAGMIFRWLAHFPEFEKEYMKARIAQSHHIFEEILEIADNATNDYMEKMNRAGGTFLAPNTELILRSKLRVEARLKIIALLNPKVYSESKKLEVSGNVTHTALTDAQLDARLKSLETQDTPSEPLQISHEVVGNG